MKITLESTSRFVEAYGKRYLVWEGKTEGGVEVFTTIPRIAIPNPEDRALFEAELRAASIDSDTLLGGLSR
jgi:hypothetical protein